MSNKAKNKILLPLIGFLAGIANGLLGAGGGIIIVYGMDCLFDDGVMQKRDVFANALCVMLPISAVSCICYAIRGNLPISGIGIYSIPSILGGAVGGILLGKIRSDALKKLFTAIVIWSGVLLIIR